MRPALPVRLWCWNGWSDKWFAASSKARPTRKSSVGRDAPIPPHGNLADCSKRCKSFVGDDACCPACWAMATTCIPRQIESQCFLPHRFMIKIKPPCLYCKQNALQYQQGGFVMEVHRGEVFYADLSPVVGSEQGESAGTYHSERYRQPAQPHRDRCRHHQQAG